jgi:hypothetical protein
MGRGECSGRDIVADGLDERIGTHDRTLADHEPSNSGLRLFDTASYFNFTKSKTKIAHTPTVTGN